MMMMGMGMSFVGGELALVSALSEVGQMLTNRQFTRKHRHINVNVNVNVHLYFVNVFQTCPNSSI